MKLDTFDALRAANIARLPLFKSRLGAPAHSQPDGSDWALSTWCNAVLGELGELANLIKKVERGDLGLAEARAELLAECADVLSYLDILAFRLDVDLGRAYGAAFNLDDVKSALRSTQPLSTACMTVAVRLGRVMESVEWIERCAPTPRPYDHDVALGRVVLWLEVLSTRIGGRLDDDVVAKFNVVSRRVGAAVFIVRGALGFLTVQASEA